MVSRFLIALIPSIDSLDPAKQALAGTLTSRLRSVFAYALTITVRETEPKVEFEELLPSWFWPTLEQLIHAETVASKEAQVRLGLRFDYYFLPEASVKESFRRPRDLDIDLITSHCARTPGNTSGGVPSLLKSYGLLDNRIVLSPLGGATQSDIDLLREANAYISASTSTEMTMGLGPPCCFRHDLDGVNDICSLGIDCHCTTSGSMINEVRAGLLAARGSHATHHISTKGSLPSSVCSTSEDAFKMIMIQGACALNMEDEIGSIAVGKKADLVVFNTSTTAMTVAAQRDPVEAIIMHSSVSDVDTLVVDGVIRKRGGRLLPVSAVQWEKDRGDFVGRANLIMHDAVRRELLTTSERFAVANLRSRSRARRLSAYVSCR